MSADLAILAALPGIAGLLHHRGGIILSQRLPADVTTDHAAALCTAVSRAFANYAGSGRALREAWFAFPGRSVLVVARPAETPEEFLTLFVTDHRAVAEAVRAAGEFWSTR